MGAPFHLVALAELHGKAEQPEERLKRLAEAAVLVEKTGERRAAAEMHRLCGILLLSMNKHNAAEDSLNQALAVARQQNGKFWELRAATSLAQLWRDQGKQSGAHGLLAPIHDWFTEGFDTPDLRNAKIFRDELR